MIYNTKDVEINGCPRILISLQDFPDTWFVLEGVSIIEENQFARLKYHYNIIEGKSPEDIKRFEKAIGDFIVWYITNHQDQLIFKGGIE